MYELFKERFKDKSKPVFPAAYQHFVKVWKRDCPHIKIRRHTKHAICAICEKFNEDMSAARRDSERAPLKAAQVQHLKEARAERLAYHEKRERARNQPDKYLSLIIDGADQSNFALPHTHTKVSLFEEYYCFVSFLLQLSQINRFTEKGRRSQRSCKDTLDGDHQPRSLGVLRVYQRRGVLS